MKKLYSIPSSFPLFEKILRTQTDQRLLKKKNSPSFLSCFNESQRKERIEKELCSLASYSNQPFYIGRGIPCLFYREDHSCFILKKSFADLSMMKKRFLEKILLSHCDGRLEKSMRIILLTWVIPGGYGDFYTQIEVGKMLKEEFPLLDICFVTLVNEANSLENSSFPFYQVDYQLDSGMPIVVWPSHILKILRDSALILQIPTYFPSTKDLFAKLKEIPSSYPLPRHEVIEEYGFIESEWLHPPNVMNSMGLHFLELGILVKKIKTDISIWKRLQQRLQLDNKSRLFFAYLSTENGTCAFLHALLTFLKRDNKDITLCMIDLSSLLVQIDAIFSSEDIQCYRIKEIVIEVGGKRKIMRYGKRGKTLRLIHCSHLSNEEFLAMYHHSEDFVGCRGDRSFSEALSLDKIYFYDGLMHSAPFLKNLISLAMQRIDRYPSAIEYFSLLWIQVCRYWKEDPRTWVEEEFFLAQQEISAKDIGKKIGLLLKDKKCREGIKKLNDIIRREYSVQSYLIGLIYRHCMYYEFPEMEQKEKKEIAKLLRGRVSFDKMVENIFTEFEEKRNARSV